MACCNGASLDDHDVLEEDYRICQGDSKCQQSTSEMHRPVENIETTRAPGTRECNTHAGHQRRVKHDRSDLVARSQVNGRNGANALAIENDVVWVDTVPRSQCQPRCLYVRVHVFLRRPTGAHAISRIIVTTTIQQQQYTCTL